MSKGFEFAKSAFDIRRSLIGEPVHATLKLIKSLVSQDFKIRRLRSGAKIFDWVVPEEWVLDRAVLKDDAGNIYCDSNRNFLEVMLYSAPIKKWLSYDELLPHLYTSEVQADALPYVTSYYDRRWGFCLTQDNFRSLPREKNFFVDIKATFRPGNLYYGELLIEGMSKKEILFSTYVCHPNLANNELSGPALLVDLASSILALRGNHRYSYRFLFVPETIGAIAYISRNLSRLKKTVIAGIVATCVGDTRAYSFLSSRNGNTLIDRVIPRVFERLGINFEAYNWRERGSDERQFCAPGVDLPVASIMRTKYGKYPEYHTSNDKIGITLTQEGLDGSLKVYQELVRELESLLIPLSTKLCEPFLTKYGLYNTVSSLSNSLSFKIYADTLSMCDGAQDARSIAEYFNLPIEDIHSALSVLHKNGLVTYPHEIG